MRDGCAGDALEGVEPDGPGAPAGDGGEDDADDPADAAPEPPRAAVTRAGDLWLLGEHRLLCGDSTDGAAVNRVFATYDDIVAHCCEALNKLIDQPWRIISIGMRDWAHRY